MRKDTLRRVAGAALSSMSDAEIEADPASAFHIAQGAARGALRASMKTKGEKN